MDRILTKTVLPEGGLITNISPIIQGISAEGSLMIGRNFEPDNDSGGYRRITGYTKFDTTAVTGTGRVKGCWVFDDKVLAVRDQHIYSSIGAGWSAALNATAFNATPTKYRARPFRFTTDKLMITNGVDYPIRWDGTTLDILDNATFTNVPTTAEGATCAEEFKRHMFLAIGDTIIFSAPGDEEDFQAGSGGGEVSVGFTVVNMRSFRNALYVFGDKDILKITGTNNTDFASEPVTRGTGLAAPDTIVEIAGDLMFLSRDGVRGLSSVATEDLTAVNLTSASRQIDKSIALLDIDGGNIEYSATFYRKKSQFRLIGADATQSRADARGILGGLRQSLQGNISWEWYDILGIQGTCADNGFFSDQEIMIFGTLDGFIMEMESGDDFGGNAVDALIRFPYWAFDDLSIRKYLRDLTIHIATEGTVDPTIGYTLEYLDAARIQPSGHTSIQTDVGFSLWDDATTVYGTAVYGDAAQFIISKFNLKGTCFNASFYVSSNDSLSPYSVQMLSVQYGLGGRN